MFYLENFDSLHGGKLGFKCTTCISERKNMRQELLYAGVSTALLLQGSPGDCGRGDCRAALTTEAGRGTGTELFLSNASGTPLNHTVSQSRLGEVEILFYFFSGRVCFWKNKIKNIYRRKINRLPQSKQIEKPFFFVKVEIYEEIWMYWYGLDLTHLEMTSVKLKVCCKINIQKCNISLTQTTCGKS